MRRWDLFWDGRWSFLFSRLFLTCRISVSLTGQNQIWTQPHRQQVTSPLYFVLLFWKAPASVLLDPVILFQDALKHLCLIWNINDDFCASHKWWNWKPLSWDSFVFVDIRSLQQKFATRNWHGLTWIEMVFLQSFFRLILTFGSCCDCMGSFVPLLAAAAFTTKTGANHCVDLSASLSCGNRRRRKIPTHAAQTSAQNWELLWNNMTYFCFEPEIYMFAMFCWN